MAYTVGKKDGAQKFGFTSGKVEGFIVESYSENTGANRVDLDDGNAKPIGSVVVPSRVEVSLTVQFGADSNDMIEIGETITYDGNTIGVTSAEVTEAQSDYVRMSLSGYVLTNGSLTSLTDIG